jgi:putative ABC transport system ATP-binding protein
MIELKGVSKIYKIENNPFYALRDIDLTIQKGEMVAIQGRSGAGKSTLMHILGCLDTFDTGSYILDGEDISKMKPAKLAELRNTKFGFVLQDFSLINHKTSLYNVMAPLLFSKVSYRSIKPRARKALEDLGLGSQIKKEVIKMSGGQRQRVAIARAIVNNPPVILADEPTGNLDSTTANDIMEIFTKLHKEGKTIIIVTHDDKVASFCDRIITISDGKITA